MTRSEADTIKSWIEARYELARAEYNCARGAGNTAKAVAYAHKMIAYGECRNAVLRLVPVSE